jgi:hypothetical protein
MQFLVLLGIQARSAHREILTAQLVQLEIQAVNGLLESGAVSQAWKRQDCPCVALLLHAFNEQECRAILAGLPFSKAGILDIQLIAPVQPYTEVYPDPSPAAIARVSCADQETVPAGEAPAAPDHRS